MDAACEGAHKIIVCLGNCYNRQQNEHDRVVFSTLVKHGGLWLYRVAMMKRAISLLPLCLLFEACKEPVRTYRVAAEKESEISAAKEVPPASEKSELAVSWEASPTWNKAKAGQFLTADYTIPDLGRLTVSQLGGDGGGLAGNVNRWRGQVNLPPMAEDKIIGQPMSVTNSKHQMLLFNLTYDTAAPDAEGIFAAVLPLGTETWYFKLTGPTSKLRESGTAVFTAFLKSVRVNGGSAEQSPAPPPSQPKIKVIAPDGWEPGQTSSMRVASFAVKNADGASADVSVIPLSGNSGSLLDNVNRWRGQIQLPPLASADDPALGVEMDGSAGKIFITHMVSEGPVLDGKKAAISAAILKSNGTAWFFKITGEASLVEANREKFEQFARSATFP